MKSIERCPGSLRGEPENINRREISFGRENFGDQDTDLETMSTGLSYVICCKINLNRNWYYGCSFRIYQVLIWKSDIESRDLLGVFTGSWA